MSGKIHIDRKNTSFTIKLFEFLKKLEFDNTEYGFLKYHQNIARYYVNNVDTRTSRGILLYHEMGMGKTILAVSIAMDNMDNYQPIILLTKSLQTNFKKGIVKYMKLRGSIDPNYHFNNISDEDVLKWIEDNYSFVSMNASNMIKQMVDATEGTLGKEYKKVMKKKKLYDEIDKNIEDVVTMGNLDNKLLIIDEAHNLFRAITNGSKNALQLYDMIKNAKNLKLILLTGTPMSNDPFELVPCFNMLSISPEPLLPEIWKEFYSYFVANGKITNKGKFQNRIMGMVSYASHKSTPGKGTGRDIKAPKIEFPEKLPTVVEFIPMNVFQYIAYKLAREKEMEEGRGFVSTKIKTVPSLQKPKNETTSSYRQKSRQISNFNPPERFKGAKFSEIPVDQLKPDELNSPKHAAILANIMKSPGNGMVYSQFVGAGGLGSFMQLLENSGWELYPGQKKSTIKELIKEEQKENPPEKEESEEIAISPVPLAEYVKIPSDNLPDDSTADIETAAQESPDYKEYKIEENIKISPDVQLTDVDFTGGNDFIDHDQHHNDNTDNTAGFSGELSECVTGGEDSAENTKKPDDISRIFDKRSQYLKDFRGIAGGIDVTKFREIFSDEMKKISKIPDNVIIRPLDKSDIDAITKLYSSVFSESISKHDLFRYVGKEFDKSAEVIPGGLVAEENKTIIGVLLYKDYPKKREITITSVITGSHIISDILFNKIRDYVVSNSYADINISLMNKNSEKNRLFYSKYDISVKRNTPGKTGGNSETRYILMKNPEEDAPELSRFIEKNKSNALIPFHPDIARLKRWIADKTVVCIKNGDKITGVVVFTVESDDLAVNYAIFDCINEEYFHQIFAYLSDHLQLSNSSEHISANIHMPVSKYRKDIISILDTIGCKQVNSAGEVLIYKCIPANPAIPYIGGFTADKSEFNLNIFANMSIDVSADTSIDTSNMIVSGLPENLKGFHQYKEKYYDWPYVNFAIMKKGKKYPVGYIVMKFQEDKSDESEKDLVQIYIKKFIIEDKYITDKYIDTDIPGVLLNIASVLFAQNPVSRMIAKIKVEKENIRHIFENNNYKLINNIAGRWIFEYIPSGKTGGGSSKTQKSGRKRYYAFITGAVDTDQRQEIQNVYNSRENMYGGIIDLILLSSTGAEGLDLKNVRHEHIMEPYWTWSRILQIESRGIRNDALTDLPEDQRNVQVYIYLAVKPTAETGEIDYSGIVNKAIETGNDAAIKSYYTTDLELYVDSAKNQKLIESFESALKEISIECMVNGEPYCRVCDPNNTDIYYDDIENDMRFLDPCIPAEEKKINAEKIVFNNTEYYYAPDSASLFDYKVYEFSDELQKYVPLADTDPLLEKIVDEINSVKTKKSK